LCARSASILFGVNPVSYAAAISGQGTWETTLQPRDLDGNPNTVEAYYDTDLDITWLADTNYAQTSGFVSDGLMDWQTATTWAAGLTIGNITGWKLPDTNPVNGISYNYTIGWDGTSDMVYNVGAPGTIYAGSTGSEMAHMFYITLGNKAAVDINGNAFVPGWGLTNTGPFSNFHPDEYYWSNTLDARDTTAAWIFDFSDGSQATFNCLQYFNMAWLVHSGDVGTAVAPVPEAVWLFGSGLLGLIGVARRKKSV
jgi:hypothetical protein